MLSLSAATLVLITLLLAGQAAGQAQAVETLLAGASNNYVVNSNDDLPDADVLDGQCISTVTAACTLRAAIMQTNLDPGPQTITVPSGVFLLTRVAADDTANGGDLDISDALTIQGAGSAATIVDGNGPVTNDRVFQILTSAPTVSINGLTIRNGKAVTTTSGLLGGGILVKGILGSSALLTLSDVIFEANTAFQGGGLYAESTAVFLNNVRLLGNMAYQTGGAYARNTTLDLNNVLIEGNISTDGDGGGLFGDGAVLTLTNTTLHANSTTSIGGGLGANLSKVTIRDSKLYSNTAGGGGGGLELINVNSALALIERTEIYSNTAGIGGGIFNGSGSALTLLDSDLHHNHAAARGGAIDNLGTLVISRTAVDANTAALTGGGIMIESTSSPPNPSLPNILIEGSTLSRNTAQFGGAIYYNEIVPNHSLVMRNSTLSGNSVNHDGGGLYALGEAQVLLFNITIAGNAATKQVGQTFPVRGGGLFITATAIITAQNTLMADNVHAFGFNTPVPDDCFVAATTSLHSLGYNLVETTTNCIISGTTFGNVTGQDPILGPLQNNGGATLTRALLPGSPALDSGDMSGCQDEHNQPVTTDQRGVPRPSGPRCDIGAYEAATHISQAISFAPIPNKSLPAAPFVITASASSGLTVTFGANPPAVCGVSASTLKFRISSATVTLLKAGSCTLTAQQPGDVTFNPAAPVPRTFNINLRLFLPLVKR